ncbi:MAG: hypothetical protein Q6366_011365, partial [Candidatus Freyarchaeota archaeon]
MTAAGFLWFPNSYVGGEYYLNSTKIAQTSLIVNICFKCDSFKFFNNYQDYIKTSKWEKLKEKFEEDGSYGVIAGLNPSRGLYFWMGSPHKTFVAIKRGMVVITSAEWRMKKV